MILFTIAFILICVIMWLTLIFIIRLFL